MRPPHQGYQAYLGLAEPQTQYSGGKQIIGRWFHGPLPLEIGEALYKGMSGVYLVECLGPFGSYTVYVGQSIDAGDRIDGHEHYLDWCRSALGPLVVSFHPEYRRDERLVAEAETRRATNPIVGF